MDGPPGRRVRARGGRLLARNGRTGRRRVDVELLIAVVTAVAGAVALASGLAGLALHRSLSRGRRDDPRGRLGFMAAAGALAGFVFLLIILLGGIQIVGLDSCVPS